MTRVRMLLHYGVVPYLVFDGDYLPSKAGTEKDRLSRREEAKKQGSELLRLGKTTQAHQEMQKAVDVTPEMAGLLIQELKRQNVKFVVAPYEADSQLAYLEKHGHIQAVISEDSDLLVVGVRTLLTKLDQFGECVMLRQDDFIQCREVSFAGWELQQFRRMAILSGCDYLDNIVNLGLKTAYRLLRKHKTVERVLQAVRLEGKLKVPPTYLEDFTRAELTFLHQWVVCPTSKSMVNLTAVEKSQNIEAMMEFIGHFVEAELAAGVADGSLHPHTKKPLVLPNVGQYKSRHTPLKQQQENLASNKSVTITEFFKKRQPLAELDPNSFVLTPHQEQLARQAALSSWSSPAAPITPIINRPTVPARSTSASLPETSRTRSLETPTQRHVKRQRLCDVDDLLKDVGDIKSVMTGSSKFFSNTKKDKRKRRSTGFSIYSDDSIDEAFNAIPDPVVTPVTEKEKSSHSAVLAAPIPKDDSEQDIDNDDSQMTLVGLSTPATIANPAFDDVEETFVEHEEDDNSSTKPIAGLFDAFVLPKSALGMKSLLKKRPSTARSVTTSSGKTCLTTDSKSFSTSSIQDDTSNVASDSLSASKPSHQAYTSNTGRVVKKMKSRAAMPQVGPVLVPNCSPVTPGDCLAQLVQGQGSEDLLIADSDCEDDGSPQSPKVLDLKRFAFTTSA
jgi:exonuclease-1